MRKLAVLAIAVAAILISGVAAQAGGWHRGPPCPDTWYWHLTPKAYAQWREFDVLRGSWGERYKVVRRHRGLLTVKVWRPFPPSRCG
jgi:hypothetical protein